MACYFMCNRKRHNEQQSIYWIVTKQHLILSYTPNSSSFLQIVGMSLMSYIQRKQIQNVNIVHVHLAYEEMKSIFSNLSVILSLTWKEEDGSELITKVKNAFQVALPQNKVTMISTENLDLEDDS